MSSAADGPRVLVIGVGNRWRHDDAAGLAVARRLRDGEPDTRVTVQEFEGEPIGLIDAWQGVDRLVLVDAVASRAAPGTVHRIDVTGDPLPASVMSSSHLVSLAEAIELARALGRLPAQAVLYGIEGEDFTAGDGLSATVARAVDHVAQAVMREIAAA